MSIIVAGKLEIQPGSRELFIQGSLASIAQARELNTCEEFSVSPDPIDDNRVNVFEKWSSRRALDAFRNAGPESKIFSLVESFDVKEYEIDA